MNIAELVITTIIAVIGLYLANSFRRQQRLRIAEQRLEAYRHLWSRMLVARPTRLEAPEELGPLTRAEAATLYREMTQWYFADGNGMLLSDPSKEMYLLAKRRLGRYAVGLDGADEAGARRRMRELSLLRSQMKADLAIYGVFYFDSLDVEDKEFLRAAGMNPWLWQRPWHELLSNARRRRRAAKSGALWPDETLPEPPRALA
jgi:hypothetical protein